MRPVSWSVTVSLSLAVLVACTPQRPPADPPAPEPVAVDAPIDAVARAAREELALRQIAFDAADTSSRAIASALVPVDYGPDFAVADCGRGRGRGYATYRVRLTADGSRTLLTPELSVRRQSLGGPTGNLPPEGDLGRCTSRRVWEAEFAEAVKARAEGRPLTIGHYPDPRAKPFTAARDGAEFYVNAASCRAVRAMPTEGRRYFASEEEARREGLRRSTERGC